MRREGVWTVLAVTKKPKTISASGRCPKDLATIAAKPSDGARNGINASCCPKKLALVISSRKFNGVCAVSAMVSSRQ